MNNPSQRKSVAYAVAACCLGAAALFLLQCTKNPSEPAYEDDTDTWTFTISVQDGNSGMKLEGATVSFTNREMKDSSATTNSAGTAVISGLAPGARNFEVAFTADSTKSYTRMFVSAAGVVDSASPTGDLLDVSRVVKLYPLSGAINGTIVARRHKLAPTENVEGSLIKVTFPGTAMENAYPQSFETTTDETGAFTISGMPVGADAVVIIPSVTLSGIDYSASANRSNDTLPLVNGRSVPLGTITMNPIDASQFTLVSGLTKAVVPGTPIELTYSKEVDSSYSYAKLEAVSTDAANVSLTVTDSANKLLITPRQNLADQKQYKLYVYAFGARGGEHVYIEEFTARGGNVEYISTSNVIDPAGNPIDGLGLTDSIIFTFAESLLTASASVKQQPGDLPVLVDVSYAGDTLRIDPRGAWKSATYDVTVSARLETGTPVSFQVQIVTEGAFDFKSSNVYDPNKSQAINGMPNTDTITFVTNKPLQSADVILNQVGGSNVPSSALISDDTLRIIPAGTLKPATEYYLRLTAKTTAGESKSLAYSFTTGSSDFYAHTSNIRYDGDPEKPVLDFPPNGTIRIVMSDTVKSATARMTSVAGLPVTVTVSDDTIRIDPQQNLKEATAYTLAVFVESKEGVAYSANPFVTEFYVKNSFYPVGDNIRYNGDPDDPVLDFAPNGTIVIVMSDSVVSATARISGGMDPAVDLALSGDTIKIAPSANFQEGTAYELYLSAKNSDGLTFTADQAGSEYVDGFRVQSKVRVIASNVLSKDGLGLRGVPVGATMHYVLSARPDSASIDVEVEGGTVNVTVTVRSDTVFVDPVSNFDYGREVDVTIKGKATDGNLIDIDLTDADKDFHTERAVYVVASNTRDANGNDAKGFPIYGRMWVKFSETLDNDIGKLVWANSSGTNDLYGDTADGRYNAAVSINEDTLFVTPNRNLIALTYGDEVGFNVQITTGSGKISEALDFTVTIEESDFYGVWTNAKDSLGKVRKDFGLQDSALIVTSLPVARITDVAGMAGKTAPPNLTMDNVTLSATGDTILYKPSIKLNTGTNYGITYTVDLQNGVRDQTVSVEWETVRGITVESVNNRVVSTGRYRPFALSGDSLVVGFSRAVDTSGSAPTRFKVNNFVTDYTVTWDSEVKVATIKNIDTLKAAEYGASNPYTATAGGTKAYTVTFDVTSVDGETKTALSAASAIEIHTEYGLCIVDANVLKMHDLQTPVAAGNPVTDSFPDDGSPTVTFNRAIDTAKIKTADANYYVRLYSSSATSIPLEIALSFSADAKTITVNPNTNLTKGGSYYVWLRDVPGLGIEFAPAIGSHSGTTSGLGGSNDGGNYLVTSAFSVPADAKPDISALQVTAAADTAEAAVGILNNRFGASAEIGSFTSNAAYQNSDTELNLLVTQAAWNVNHDDSVTGYQWRARKHTRDGTAGDWFTATTPASFVVPGAGDYLTGINVDQTNADNAQAEMTVNPSGEDFYSLLQTARQSGSGYSNATCLFNDSSRIEVQLRPVLEHDNPADGAYGKAGEHGTWSNSVYFSDNVAPCDSDFVTAANCNSLGDGGVLVTENVDFDNSTGSAPDSSGYIDITFPEDMDATSTVPGVTFFYGPFGGSDPAEALSTVAAAADKTRWTSARTYRIYVIVPEFDYTHASSGEGAFFNVSVAGCKDASGNEIHTYGSNGGLAETSISAAGRSNRAAASAGQVQGSSSVISGFTLCN